MVHLRVVPPLQEALLQEQVVPQQAQEAPQRALEALLRELEAQVEAQVLETRAALALAQVEVKVLALAVESVVARVREQVEA